MHRRGYLFRQLVGLSLVVATPFLLLIAYNAHQQSEQARESAYQAVTNYAQSIAQEAESLLAEVDQYLAYLSNRPLILALDRQRCDPVLDGVVQRRRHFANVLITDAAGAPVCLAIDGPGTVPASFADAPWYRQAQLADATVTSKPYQAPIAQKVVLAISVPLNRPGESRIGTLTVLLDLKSVQQTWERLTLPAGSRLSIFDAQGTLLTTRPDFDTRVGTDASTTLAAAMRANPGGVGVARGIDGVERTSPASTWREADGRRRPRSRRMPSSPPRAISPGATWSSALSSR